ncbi:unnamed protein product [Nippostrongylus brasiliensis]|uniref:G protein-coupled receptor n=1 Tax=Nippostrongylus brasiliensis TaxID=27835 RepID=A0A0N4XU82_NIPBR|nr:unnamed protein product [Nippostrongylus brasiliensis]
MSSTPTALQCFRASHPNEPAVVNRIVLGVSLIFFTPISLILNILLLLIVVKSTIVDGHFGRHVISLITASLVYLMANVLALIPTTVANVHLPDPWNIILSSTDNLGYLALMFTTANVALDRFLFFFTPTPTVATLDSRKISNFFTFTQNEMGKFFSRTCPEPIKLSRSRVHREISLRFGISVIFASLPWFFSIFFTAHMALQNCYTRTDPYTLTFTYACSTCIFYGPLLYWFGYVFPAINFALYAFIYARILMIRYHFHLSVFQFSIICALQFASSACFYVLPALIRNNDLAFHLPMIISTMNTMTNPCVMMIFQPRIRRSSWELITKCNFRTIVFPTSVSVAPRSVHRTFTDRNTSAK